MKPTEYSLARAFKRIEEELIKSMIRNFEKHKAEETEEGFNWDQWQVVQLRELEKYRKQNAKRFDKEFEDLNSQVDELLRMTNDDAQTEQEYIILDQIKKGNFEVPEEDPGLSAELFAVNEEKLNALVDSTTKDLEKAEHAVLRRSNDIYRKVINDAQVYAVSGGTYEQAIDMATKDFAMRGIRSIVYKNGARHTIEDYASMAIRTAGKRAYLMGEGKKHAEYGIHTVRVAKRTDACPLCLRWTGKVLIDDVYGGGTKQEAREKRLPLLSTAMAKGLYHPNCRDVHSLYIEGVSKPAEPWSEYDLRVLADKYNYEQKEKHAKTMLQGWTRVAETRLDPENKKKAEAHVRDWEDRLADIQQEPKPIEFEVREEMAHWFSTGQWRNYKKVDALRYEYDGFRIYLPKGYNPADQTITPQDIIYAIKDIPEDFRDLVPKQIELVDYENYEDENWRKIYKDFVQSRATYAANRDIITFYRETDHVSSAELARTLVHETGHRIDALIVLNEKYANFSDSEIWKKAMELDEKESGRKSPSSYGENSPSEDFAESIKYYVRDASIKDGGIFGRLFPNRAKLLAEIIKELKTWGL